MNRKSILKRKEEKVKSVVGRITAPQCPCPNPGTCEYATLYGKRDFVGVIKDLEWIDYPGSSKWVQSNHKGPYMGNKETRESEKMFQLEQKSQ